MFYSGWGVSGPQRIAPRGPRDDARYFIKETVSPGISLLYFRAPIININNRSTTAERRESSGRLHLKSDHPIHPHCGVFYFEVKVCSFGGNNNNNNTGGGGKNINTNIGPSEPELVIGVCRESLPSHILPGEDTSSIGLFTAQRMIYINGKSEGEAVRFPTLSKSRCTNNNNNNNNNNMNGVAVAQEERRSKGIKVGDVVGCLVNLMDGIVRFTFNGELLDVGCPLSQRMPKHGYYPAIGMFRLVSDVTLRVVFQPLGKSNSISRPWQTNNNNNNNSNSNTGDVVQSLSGTGTGERACEEEGQEEEEEEGLESAAAGGGFNTNSSLEAMTSTAGYFVFDVDKYCEGIAEELVQMYRQKAAEMTREKEDGESCTCRDVNIITAIRKHLAARGMTKALSAFEREQEELRCSLLSEDGKGIHRMDESHILKSGETSKKNSKRGSNSTSGSGNNDGVIGDSENITYSLHIQHIREEIGRGDMISATRRILTSGIISPVTHNKLSSVVENVDALPSDFWGNIFFAQRRDILFLLCAAHVLEVALDSLEKGLRELLPTNNESASNNNGNNDGNNNNTDDYNSSRVDIMSLSFRILLEPFSNVAAVTRRHQRAASHGLRSVDAAAFAPYDISSNTNININTNAAHTEESSRWPCDDLAAHLFFTGKGTLWCGPEVPVTLLVRQSVLSVPAPREGQRRRIVQAISMLVAHQRAVCARAAAEFNNNNNNNIIINNNTNTNNNNKREWVAGWLSLLAEARGQCRARCWCLLLHAIEDFNGAVEYRLLVWRQRRAREREREKAGGVIHTNNNTNNNNNNNTNNILLRDGEEEVLDGVGGGSRRFFPSLLGAWRHVHAAAALQPLLHVVTKAFSDKLQRGATAAQFATMTPINNNNNNNTTPGFGKGVKRRMCFTCDFMGSEDEEENEIDDNDNDISGKGRKSSNNKTSCYDDDVRLSFLYMKRIYKAVFA